MSGTTAVQTHVLNRANPGGDGQPLCPACGGRLHPYLVEIALSPPGNDWHGAEYLTGWVAVRVGDDDPETSGMFEALPPCGFSLPMTPHRRPFSARSSHNPTTPRGA